MNDDMTTIAKVFGDLAGIGIVIGSFAKVLPSLAAAATLIWYGIRIYEYVAQKRAGRKSPIE